MSPSLHIYIVSIIFQIFFNYLIFLKTTFCILLKLRKKLSTFAQHDKSTYKSTKSRTIQYSARKKWSSIKSSLGLRTSLCRRNRHGEGERGQTGAETHLLKVIRNAASFAFQNRGSFLRFFPFYVSFCISVRMCAREHMLGYSVRAVTIVLSRVF